MASSNFLSKFNWRLIVIHTIALGFFIYAFKMFVYLHDPEIWVKMEHGNVVGVDTKRYVNDVYWGAFSGLVGAFIGLIISLLLSLKNKWYWLNSVIAVVIAVNLMEYDLFGWGLLKHILLLPGTILESYNGYVLVNGFVMLAIGALLFFLKPIRKFINSGF